ncbi:uncharacterized protein E5676_scaffold668G00130 [Cucumis melo var. makuwa]|uniref:Uncharacterized protein n=1 Tax=Cucumis melo var. makuwa TaxID=1194695 RepID=A0A5A7SZX5_CUCMM|nr:uncharacterized protein E6C27_scaffold3921G00200 [Cucumis melo var. makuwa]TYK25998.1 uncharacterized protein E5676_scaffold668G00130 [Cucumis melo var. makuwa]
MYELKLKLIRGCGTTSTDYWNIPYYTEWVYHGESVSFRVPIEQKEKTEEDRLEDEMLRNIRVDIDEDTINIFQNLLNEARNELYPGRSEFSSNFLVKLMHTDKRIETNDVLRHPADAEGWKNFDYEFPDFASDLRNVRLGLGSDGFNPFGHMSTSYSMWYVVLLPYNLRPWKCMKETKFFMSLLILSPRSSSRKIDVYLQPLIEELKDI